MIGFSLIREHDGEEMVRLSVGRVGSSIDIRVREASTKDLWAMARLHRAAYSSDHFLAMLPEYVLVDYYGRFLKDGARAMVAVSDPDLSIGSVGEGLLGFAVFGRDIERRIAIFKRERRWSIVLVALRHPVLSFRKFLVAVKSRWAGSPPYTEAPVLLLSIAVDESAKGIGAVLLDRLLRWSASVGECRVGLYVRHHNVRAINAYLRAGFRIRSSMADQYYMEWTRVV